jgi:hypothetical protein
MGKKVRSARGEVIDFDLLKIKEQIAQTPPSVDVKKREEFIDKKFQRRLRKQKREVETMATIDVEPQITENSTEDKKEPKNERKTTKK